MRFAFSANPVNGEAMYEGIDLDRLPSAIEALLFVSDEPVSAIVLAKMFDENVEEIELALETLRRRLDESESGIQLQELAGGWRLCTHPAFHEVIQKYVLSWDTRRLSSAALETLAVVAYSQPVTRAQISAIRGVSSDTALATLVDRGYVREAGSSDAPGNPMLYATTRSFLEKYGLRSVADLPDLGEFAPDEQTARLIRERLGALGDEGGFHPGMQDAQIDERAIAPVDELAADAVAGALGVVEKIDFDSLTFNTDDE